jgi:tRNA (guanine-N7-)-methyltransferase
VYFPDPWPKKRHHKRRFFQRGALEHLARALRPGALLRVVTDHSEYGMLIRRLLEASPDFEDAGADAALWELPGMGDYTVLGVTNFEIKYRREGRPILRLAWRRR